jgi:hypothetical protein
VSVDFLIFIDKRFEENLHFPVALNEVDKHITEDGKGHNVAPVAAILHEIASGYVLVF